MLAFYLTIFVRITQKLKSKFPTEAEQIPRIFALSKEAVNHIHLVYTDTRHDVKNLERFAKYHISLFAEEGSSQVLRNLSDFQRMFSQCKRIREEVRLGMGLPLLILFLAATQSCVVLWLLWIKVQEELV